MTRVRQNENLCRVRKNSVFREDPISWNKVIFSFLVFFLISVFFSLGIRGMRQSGAVLNS